MAVAPHPPSNIRELNQSATEIADLASGVDAASQTSTVKAAPETTNAFLDIGYTSPKDATRYKRAGTDDPLSPPTRPRKHARRYVGSVPEPGERGITEPMPGEPFSEPLNPEEVKQALAGIAGVREVLAHTGQKF